MATTDPLTLRAEPHFFDAIATFGRPGDDLHLLAQAIAQEAKLAGFSKSGRRKLLEYLLEFLGMLDATGTNPFACGRVVEEAASLFSQARLGGLFDPDSDRAKQGELFSAEPDEERERALLDQLIAATRLYDTKEAVKALLDFTIKLRGFAPFNAMLLHIQKPGLSYAATAYDWYERFGQVPKKGARPLLVLRVMGPVDFVFDILDVEGPDLPSTAFIFPTLGDISNARFNEIMSAVARTGIEIVELDAGDRRAGWIRLVARSTKPKGKHHYQLAYNRNHAVGTCLVTVAHELAHLYLGHLGEDKGRSIRDRRDRTLAQREVEAEMAAYLVAKRNGLTPRSESYLASYRGAMAGIDLYAVMRVANAVETCMGIAAHQLENTMAF